MKQKRVVIYARVSTTVQDTQNQIAQLTKHADSQGWEVVKIYQDDETGTEGRRTRASFNRLFMEAGKKKFDLVLFWALDRFTREGMFKTIAYLQQLDMYGVTFCSYTEPHLNTDNELVRNILLATLSSLAKVEAEKISQRTKAGLERARRQGKQIGRPGLDPEIRQRIVELDSKAMTDTARLRELGISRNTLKKYRARIAEAAG